MLRVALKHGDAPPRLFTEDEFIHEIHDLEASAFAGAPAGPVKVEGLDAEGRVCWCAYYASMERLVTLAQQLIRERKAARRS